MIQLQSIVLQHYSLKEHKPLTLLALITNNLRIVRYTMLEKQLLMRGGVPQKKVVGDFFK